MKRIKKIAIKFAAFLPAVAMVMGIISANSACASFYYQPETPNAMDAYRK